MATEESGLPNTRKTFEQGLRGFDYTFETAIADIVDNSVQANASKIDIHITDRAEKVFVLDNGDGMDDATHRQAMVLFSETHDYRSNDLGKFGTGMKAASLSQADRLTVITRTSSTTPPSIRVLDLGHISKTNDWSRLILKKEETELPADLRTFVPPQSGTCIVWEELKFSESADRAISESDYLKLLDSLEKHLSGAFHRFLEGNAKGFPKLEIRLNGIKLIGWNPFAPNEPTIAIAEPQVFEFSTGSKITARGYVIPAKAEYASNEAFEEAKGPKPFNDGQGFYCYRNNRLIKAGGWLGIMASDPHTSLARVSLDFDSGLDGTLGVNINKSEIRLPPLVKQKFSQLVSATTSQARKRYSAKTRKEGSTLSSLPVRSGSGSSPLPPRRHTASQLASILEEVAQQQRLTSELLALKTAVRHESLTIAQELGW